MPFLFRLIVPRQKFFLGQDVKQVRGGKEVVHVQFITKSFYPLSDVTNVGCCEVCRPLSLPRSTFMSYPVDSHSLNIFMPKRLRFSVCNV